MNLTKHKGFCICSVCKKKCEESFEIDFNKRFFSKPKICLLCAKTFYFALAKELVPKSPRNINFGYKVLKDKDL